MSKHLLSVIGRNNTSPSYQVLTTKESYRSNTDQKEKKHAKNYIKELNNIITVI